MTTPLPFGFETIWHWLLAYGLALGRPTAMLAVNPVFTRAQISGVIRGAVATALAMPMVPVIAATLPETGLGMVGLLLLAAKEALIGGALGLLLGAPFWALDIAGDVLDAQRGATQGRLNDPAGFGDVSISGTMLVVAGIALFVATGGLITLARLLYDSWALWRPLGSFPEFDSRTPGLLLGLLDSITRQGLLLAVPPVIAMLVADAALMLVARIAPQLRIDDLALSLRNIVFFLILPPYILFLVTYVRHDLAGLPQLFDLLRQTAPATAPGVAP